MEKFTPTRFRASTSDVFNSVQHNGAALIVSKSRPDMVLMLNDERLALLEKIKRLTDLAEAQ